MDTKNRHCNVFLAAPLGKFAIEEKMSGNMIGTIDLRVDPLKEVAELGYTLNKSFLGARDRTGSCSDAFVFGFEKLALVRIYALHDQRNHRSGRVMEKNWHESGSTDSGCAKISWASSGRSDAGITRDEWQKTNHVKENRYGNND